MKSVFKLSEAVIYLVIGASCWPLNAFGQPAENKSSKHANISGIPRVIHYTKEDFNSDPQFWRMGQGANGILYFGNNDGVLIFDAERWQKVKLPNSSSVRSIKVSSTGDVYVGGFNEFGVVRQDEFGQYHYQSLLHLLRPEDRNLENIWQIHEAQGYMVFRSAQMLIAIAENKAITIPAASILYSTVIDNELYVADADAIKKLDLHSLEYRDVILQPPFRGEDIVSILPGFANKGMSIVTKKGIIYSLDTKRSNITVQKRLIPENSNDLILCGIKSSTGIYYFGTLSSKVILLHESGEQEIASEAFQDLQDNTVLNLFESQDGNIWALLNNGLDCIDISSPVTMLFDNAAVYDVLHLDQKLYLATNQGAFVSKHSVTGRPDFVKIDGLEGQAWRIHSYKNILLCAHDRGIFIIGDKGVKQLPGVKGVWKVIPVRDRPNDFFACTYDGIYLLRFDEKFGFAIQHRVEGFNESARDILQGDEPGIFWVCHGYKGVFRIKINDQLNRVIGLEHFKDQNGLLSPFNINVFRWNSDIIFTTNQGIFTFDKTANRFTLHAKLTSLFGREQNVRKILQHEERTWFIHDDEAGYFISQATDPSLEKGLFLSLKGSFNKSMECIVPTSENNVLMGTITGLYAFDLTYNASKNPSPTIITEVTAQQQKIVNGPLLTSRRKPFYLPNTTSSIRFNFAAPEFRDKQNIQYSYKLDNVDTHWSEWQAASFKEFNYLRSGNYTFQVKSRSLLGERSHEATYYFEIIPAWYQSTAAYVIYVVSAIFLMVLGTTTVKRMIKYEKQKTRKEEEKKRKVLELEIQQIKLKQEKEQITRDKEQLEEDVIFKSKELANYTMLLVKKRELLAELNGDLKILKAGVRNDNLRQLLHDVMKKINSNLQSEEHIQVFEANFERVHSSFFAQLKSTFPDLTQKELQLCAFVRMNLTNKEIASILNISFRGVETARYRLRKRLGITHERYMGAFLEKLYAGDKRPDDHSEDSI